MGRAEVKLISKMLLEELILLQSGGKYLAIEETENEPCRSVTRSRQVGPS